MSPIATTLSRRAFGVTPVRGTASARVSTRATPAPVPTMADLRPGDRATIVGYGAADPRVTRRLFDLGLAPGADVEVLRVAPLKDPVIFRVADYEVALRRSEARGIHVART